MPSVSILGIGQSYGAVGTIKNAWVEWGGDINPTIPQGEKFDVHVDFATTRKTGWTDKWSACLTVVDEQTGGNLVSNYNIHTPLGGGANTIQQSDTSLDKMGKNVMPGVGLILRIKLWANPNPQDNPPSKSEW